MKTTHIEWDHPHKGKIVEEVCDKHDAQVMQALKVLGIGCLGTIGKLGICWRCIYDGYEFRTWMDQIDMESAL